MRGPSVGAAVIQAWERVREPRVQRSVYVIVYLACASAGASVWHHPPTSIEGVIGVWLTYGWGTFLLVGGTAAAVAVLPGWWWLEKIGAVSLTTGGAIYATTVLALQLSSEGGNRLPQFLIIVAGALLLGLRAYEIRGLDYEPRG